MKDSDPRDYQYPVADFPAWLAGMFEIGGSLHFQIHRSSRGDKEYTTAIPVMQMRDNHPDRLEKLRLLAGGKVYPVGRPKEWKTWSQHAVWLGELIRPFAPKRQGAIEAFQLWDRRDSPAEGIDIARMQREVALTTIKPDLLGVAYSSLVINNDFLGGVLAGRGCVTTHEKYDRGKAFDTIYPVVVICASNRELVAAIDRVDPGNFRQQHHVGDVKEFPGGKFATIKHPTYHWESQSHELLSRINPHIRLFDLFASEG